MWVHVYRGKKMKREKEEKKKSGNYPYWKSYY